MGEAMDLPAGLYERIVTGRLRRALAAVEDLVPEIADVDEAEEPGILARHIFDVAHRSLSTRRRSSERIDLAQRVLAVLVEPENDADTLAFDGDRSQRLMELARRPTIGGPAHRTSVRPSTPLSDAALLTNAPDEPSLGSELRRELDSADGVDLLCAFVKWHGIRVLESELARLRDRGVRLRVVTTTYVGATERVALDRLVNDFGAQIKVQYDPLRTRLHAKAWLFRRATGFDTGFVGSSNLSRSALLDGVEWNVRLSSVATPTLLSTFAATFDTYWNDESFEFYDPCRDGDRLDDALLAARGGDRMRTSPVLLSGLEVRPYPHQLRMLEQLASERANHDRHRNLVVAATGTGKTVVAALDYRSLAQPHRTPPTLLFVAHRQEILDQSLRTYREVLGDASFGEQLVGGVRPDRWQHVFASVQSLHNRGVADIRPDAFDVVVIDEFHHANAATYRALLDHLRPVELLGLTATPERSDGFDVRTFFAGRVAADLRLWDALAAGLLSPFHYFGLADNTDLESVAWSRGSYETAGLDRVYTGNDARAHIVLRQVRDKISDPRRMRALGFCVSVAHARYMAGVFTAAGLPATVITGETASSERGTALQKLQEGRITTIFAVDVFNEGVDLPAVDTILFLRPTESATIFLQQLGRGLRLAPGKAVLTVLDFVGHHRREFRFDLRFRALTGTSRRQLERQVEQGFPFLPSGSQIVLDRQTQQYVLENLRRQISNRWPDLRDELRRLAASVPDIDLAQFLDEAGLELGDVISTVSRAKRSWTELRRSAGLSTPPGGSHETSLLTRVRALAHVDDPSRLTSYRAILKDPLAAPTDNPLTRMLLFSLWPGGFGTERDALARLASEPAARDEMRQVVDLAFDRTRRITVEPDGPLARTPLRVHARYSRDEIVTALGWTTADKSPQLMREGVFRSEQWNADVFLVTLRKSETDYSPTTMYRDFAISPTLLHWESQSTTSIASPTGQRYLRHRELGSEILIFVRHHKAGDLGAEPYFFLGHADYVSHTGDRPIAITWRLRQAMPPDLYASAKVAAG